MPTRNHDQILTVVQMRAAEDALIAGGSSVEALMDLAGRGAAEWVWRMAGRERVTVLCGPGNNGGDGYVLAEAIREKGGSVGVIAAYPPRTPAAANARSLYRGEVLERGVAASGEVLVDCLFGSGLARPLASEDVELLAALAATHRQRVAMDLPSGVQSDNGMLLNAGLPQFDLTIALGAWKLAHFLMPAVQIMGARKLVGIGVALVEGAAIPLGQPHLQPPSPEAHKYTRGLLAVVAGAMPGAAVLAATAAQCAGAGYVKLLAEQAIDVPCDLVLERAPLGDALIDKRIRAMLAGPGLGRDAKAHERLSAALGTARPVVLDADALLLLDRQGLVARSAPVIATPHEGELAAMERTFGCVGSGSKPERARNLARSTGAFIVAKGPDTVVAAPDGRLACANPATSWLSTAGTGDVLAGTIASRLATGADPFAAACEGVWLHGEAARLCGPAFTAAHLAAAVPAALAACL